MAWLKKWRRNHRSKKPFPKEWLRIIRTNVPFYDYLPPADQAELQRHILIFLSEKRFEGCRGLTITDEIKVTIAAQACLLLLHRKTDYYPGLISILVYPHAFMVSRVEHLPGGVVAEGQQVLLGESWQSGAVILSWDDVKHSSSDFRNGHNVVFHEFAHQIDTSEGKGDSTVVLKDSSSFIAWARILKKDYDKLRLAAEQNHPAFLDKYGATSPAEFFAVATEFFFTKPKELKHNHPQLYNELKNFYYQDPATYLG